MHKVREGQSNHQREPAKPTEHMTAELRLAGLAKVNLVED